MKKLVLITAAVAVLSSSSAFAKTEGNYVGVDLHKAVTSSRYINNGSAGTSGIGLNAAQDQSKTGLGVSYKYAFNFDKFFVAPGVFFERIGTNTLLAVDPEFGESYISDRYFQIKNRYGIRADFGYDITDTFAAYVTGGITRTGYKSNTNINGAGAEQSDGIATLAKSKLGFMYGVGAIQHLNDNVSLGVEYNTQALTAVGANPNNQRIKSRIDLYKLTLAYHF